jgi:hypothetical protein
MTKAGASRPAPKATSTGHDGRCDVVGLSVSFLEWLLPER